jgi:hypothetical protein
MFAESFFSPDYRTARDRFRAAATAAGAALHALDLTAKGPDGERLSIDIAWLGASKPERVFLHTTGVHGVEAFTGSAVQLAILERGIVPSANGAAILVHVLNPFGMAWLRRTNENNVDLNRNFLVNGEAFSGAPELYRTLDPLLNPCSPPSRDAFHVRAAATAIRHGFHRVKQAIAEGQYEFPNGLFFGGDALQEGPRLYMDWLRQHLSATACVFALDLHTGLGRHGTDTVVPDAHVNATPREILAAALNRKFVDVSTPSVAYTVRGGIGGALPHVLPRANIDFVLQEIGTRNPLTVLHALREENRWHFHGGGSIVHPSKQRLFEALCPTEAGWRRRALQHGLELALAAAAFGLKSDGAAMAAQGGPQWPTPDSIRGKERRRS